MTSTPFWGPDFDALQAEDPEIAGVVLDELNAQLKSHNLRFAPDISTASRATVGGMMGNNSCGARSVLYGKTIDHVLEQEVVLSDGSVARVRPLTPAQLDAVESRHHPVDDRQLSRLARLAPDLQVPGHATAIRPAAV